MTSVEWEVLGVGCPVDAVLTLVFSARVGQRDIQLRGNDAAPSENGTQPEGAKDRL